MSFPKPLFIGAIFLFVLIGFFGLMKNSKKELKIKQTQIVLPKEKPKTVPPIEEKKIVYVPSLPEENRIEDLFRTDGKALDIVETLTYTSRVPWLKDRPAWIADYAAHYGTSRHFIARSLNKKADYLTQKISAGEKFNVFKKDLDIKFYILVDLKKAKLWLYCLNTTTKERILLKTYSVGLGKKDFSKNSGCCTPNGKYSLGSKIAIYRDGTKGFFKNQKIEMIEVFGTRWIPFEKELESCSEKARGLGIHGSPWNRLKNGDLEEDRSHIGKFRGDGCIRLNSEDMEEIFAIIITKPTEIELVKDFYDAKLPGYEKEQKYIRK